MSWLAANNPVCLTSQKRECTFPLLSLSHVTLTGSERHLTFFFVAGNLVNFKAFSPQFSNVSLIWSLPAGGDLIVLKKFACIWSHAIKSDHWVMLFFLLVCHQQLSPHQTSLTLDNHRSRDSYITVCWTVCHSVATLSWGTGSHHGQIGCGEMVFRLE